MQRNHWSVIINPKSGNYKAKKDFSIIKDAFQLHQLSAEYHFTNGKNHAETICRELLRSRKRNIAVVGGDGTLYEVINGVFSLGEQINPEIVLAMIPVGIGNDWCRTFGVPSDYEKSIELIKLGNTIKQDIGKIYFDNGKTRYFANVADIGFGAEVALKVNHDKSRNRHGKMVYIKNLLLSLLNSKTHKLNFTINNEIHVEDIFSMAVGIGKFNGGGMMQLPSAVVDDSLFDITIIKKINKLDVVHQIKNLYDGSFISHKSVKCLKTNEVKINSPNSILVEADGESVGSNPAFFEILPRALNVISGN